jgi:hypothetical protein
VSYQFFPIVFVVLQITCGLILLVRFRGSPGGWLGPVAYGIWALGHVTLLVLGPRSGPWSASVSYFFNLVGYGFLIAAYLTGRTVPAEMPPH